MDNPNQIEGMDRNSDGVLIAAPLIEAWVDKKAKQYHLSIAVPGMDQKDLQVSLQGNNLTVSGSARAVQTAGTSIICGRNSPAGVFSARLLYRRELTYKS
jgi:HSP20 family molecular chaperone IbpA